MAEGLQYLSALAIAPKALLPEWSLRKWGVCIQRPPGPLIPGRHGEWRAVLEVPSKGPALENQGRLETLLSGQDAGRGSGPRDSHRLHCQLRGSGPGRTLPGALAPPQLNLPCHCTGLGQVQSCLDPRSSLPPRGPRSTLGAQNDGIPLQAGSPAGSPVGSALARAPGQESRPAQAGPLPWGLRLVKLK